MAGIFLGASPEELETLAGTLEAAADEIDARVSTIQGALDGTQWTGPDSDRFRDYWTTTLTSQLQNAATSLREAGTTARGNAQQQTDASA